METFSSIMGDQPISNRRYFAILIGIDAYPRRPLRSCVQDVHTIKECFEREMSSVHIQLLTASESYNLGMTMPLPSPSLWPTLTNVISALESATSKANCGDFIYIHYSGHGTRLEPIFDFSNSSTGDLALVLLKKDGSAEEFLKGPRLAGLLKAMVDKQLVVTLVLDCCFSASVYRNTDHNIRYLPLDLMVASTYPEDADGSLTSGATCSLYRDASMRDNWLLDPDRYAILTACGPHENAQGGHDGEYKKGEDTVWHGALSYFLSKALADYGFGRRHVDIHRHLCAKFREFDKAQHPVLFGNGDQGFFGPVDQDCSVRSICVVKRDGKSQLLAGQAHGIRDGDQFFLSPQGLRTCHGAEGDCVANVSCAGPLTSELELNIPQGLQTGWMAKQLTCSYLTSFPIQLASNLPQYDQLLAQLNRRSLGASVDTDKAPVFRIVLSDNDEYEILNESGQKIINIPTMPRNQTNINHLYETLEHLARFRMAKELTNLSPTCSFRESFDLRMIMDGRDFSSGECIEVQHNDIVEISMQNKGDTNLYAHVYDLGPCWQVRCILKSTYQTVLPWKDWWNKSQSNTLRLKIKMTIPLIMDNSCEDVIKIFITSQPTSFDLLELPKLDELAKRNNGDMISHRPCNVLEDWTAFDFPIRISR
ncbi:putative caspase [Annulohypoxylon truncatum]|uniref:putative caspase n=1 Tax=Annulohypoxylon truncatum TaxID=327061 RepID=UPI0020088E2E|nr:putative caspase [Annulohypoxylon truncatum]KAI1204902.1 putative caspase [Annulohypoxylon truncatum]